MDSQRWRKNNPEKVREKKRRWRKNNPEKHREQRRRWYKNNLEKAREYFSRCYHKKQAAIRFLSVLKLNLNHIGPNENGTSNEVENRECQRTDQ